MPVPRLLVELPSRPRVFFEQSARPLFPRRLPPLELRSAPAPFWPDVFVEARPCRWVASCSPVAYHVVAFALLIGFTRFFALQPQVVAKPTFDHAQVIYYQPSEYLPPLDTRSPQEAQPAKADPEFSRQPIISVPAEADNRSQTIVTPPDVKLKHDVALPNIVAWSDRMEKPRLAIPPVPLTPAADIVRIAPQLENSVVAPTPDAAHLTHRRIRRRCRTRSSLRHPTCVASNSSALPGAATCRRRASAERRDRVHSSARRSEHRAEFRDCPCASTSGRRTARRSRTLVRPRSALRSSTRSSASVGFCCSVVGGLWSAGPSDCAEPASRRGRAARPASRQPSRHFCRHARGPRRSFRLARFGSLETLESAPMATAADKRERWIKRKGDR